VVLKIKLWQNIQKVQETKLKKPCTKKKRGQLKSGRSGKKVTSRKQAIAIGLSEAREAGEKVPRKKSSGKGRSSSGRGKSKSSGRKSSSSSSSAGGRKTAAQKSSGRSSSAKKSSGRKSSGRSSARKSSGRKSIHGRK